MKKINVVQPVAMTTIFGEDVYSASSTDDFEIPAATSTSPDDTCVQDNGFLPITSTALDDGGRAPERKNFNGMFYVSTDLRNYLQNGNLITYRADVATAIGGYPQDAVLSYIDSYGNFSLVQSLIDDNTYNFITTPSYVNDGVHWRQITLDGANKNLSNLTSAGESRLHALKSYSDEGEALTDGEGLADVVNYAHSTFDSSKFTAVGTPVISDNGIVSGFSNSSYLTFDATIPSYNTFDLYLGEYKITSLPASGTRYWLYICVASSAGFEMSIESSGKLRYFLGSGDSTWDIANSAAGTITYAIGQKVKFWLNFNGSKYTLYSSINGGAWAEDWHVDSALKALLPQTTQISQGSTNFFAGTIDLKYIKSIFDGVTVFNGCETGVDTIKPKAYTKGGSPNDVNGVVSGFSNTNTITTDFDFYPTGTWAIEGSFVTPTTAITDTWATLVWNMFGFGIKIAIYPDLKIGFKASSNGTSFDIANDIKGTSTLVAGAKYFFRLEFTGTEYNLYIKNSPTNFWHLEKTVTSSTAIYTTANTKLRIGASSGGAQPFNSTIDMNDLKVYYGDVLVYQGCLLIPYTQSSTGSKVVDTYHQSRLISMYQQFGYAPYYCLDEVNGAFSLPFGELYGLIDNAGNNFSKPDYSSGVSITAPYTAEESGFIKAKLDYVDLGSELIFKVDNVEAARYVDSSLVNEGSATTFLIPITKGQIFTETLIITAGSNAQVVYTFFKNKGV